MSRGWEEQEDEVAALWVARHLGGIIDASEFTAWLNGASGRRERFDALRATCADTAVTEALENVSERTRSGRTASVGALRPDRRVLIGGIAAALLLAVGFNWPFLRNDQMSAHIYATAAGEIRDVSLADGSQVVMNGASRMEVRISARSRDVRLLSGEAFFNVTRDVERPFSVYAGEGRASVLGTRFDIALDDARVELAVAHGLVRFQRADGKHDGELVHAGYRSTLDRDGITVPSAFDAKSILAWREGWLEVNNMPLAQLLPKIRRWSDKSIILSDTTLGTRRISGRFPLTDTQSLLENLALLHDFRVDVKESGYILSSH